MKFKESNIESGIITMSPALAEQLLATSLGNRRINNQRVAAWADDMKAGKWVVNGEPIIIDENGHLREGHHRLHAVIKANTLVDMYVVTGVKVENATIYDLGKPRSFADIAKMNGGDPLMTSSNVMALIRFHYVVQNNLRTISFPTAESFLYRNRDFLDTVSRISRASNGKFARKAPVEYAMFSAIVNGESAIKMHSFARSLNTGLYDGSEETSVIKLRDFLMTCPDRGVSSYIAMCYTAENAIRDYVNRKPRIKAYQQPCKPVYSNTPIMKLL